jgi:hypothetical protein
LFKIVLATLPAVIAAAAVSVFSPAIFGRSLSAWEDVLCGACALMVAACMLVYRKRQDRKRLTGLRDSALW